jgi:hypothetical protein
MRDDATPAQNGLTLAGTTYQSRLLVGTASTGISRKPGWPSKRAAPRSSP